MKTNKSALNSETCLAKVLGIYQVFILHQYMEPDILVLSMCVFEVRVSLFEVNQKRHVKELNIDPMVMENIVFGHNNVTDI